MFSHRGVHGWLRAGTDRRAMALMRLFVGRHASPHFGIPELERAGRAWAGRAGQGRGAPELTRRWVWRKGNLGRRWISAVKLTPRSPRKPSLPIAPLLTPCLHAHPLETFRNPQQNTPTIASTDLTSIHQGRAFQNSPLEKDRICSVGEAHDPTASTVDDARRRNTQVLAWPYPVKHVGSYITKAPSSRPLYGATKNHADDSKALPPDFFHPLLLHDDIPTCHSKCRPAAQRARPRQIFPDRLSDVIECHICARNLLTNKVMPPVASHTRTQPTTRSPCPAAVTSSQVMSCLPCQRRAGVAFNRRSWGMLIQEPARVARVGISSRPGTPRNTSAGASTRRI